LIMICTNPITLFLNKTEEGEIGKLKQIFVF
jgi:hypothetical protein